MEEEEVKKKEDEDESKIREGITMEREGGRKSRRE